MSSLNTNVAAANTQGNNLSQTVVTYYDRKLIKNAKPRLVHQRFGQKRQIPKNGGKTVNFRKFEIFPPALTPITEGVTPDGRALDMTSVTAELKQYGDYVAGSDLLDLVAVDQVLDETFELLGDQAGLTLDHITRDIIHQGTSVQYAGGKSARCMIKTTDVLTTTEIRKAVRTLKRNKAKPFMRNGKPYYVAIIDQDSAYDLMNDEKWQKVSEYQHAENIEEGEIGKLFGVVFIETTEGKKFEPTGFTAKCKSLTVDSITSGLIYVGVNGYTTAEKQEVINKIINTDVVVHYEDDDTAQDEIMKFTQGVVDGNNIKLTPEVISNITIAADDTIWPVWDGYESSTVNSTIIFGKDAFGTVDIEGEGAFKTIFKPKGSAGTGDPLDQRWTAGWKASGYTAAILQQLWMVRIEHGYSR